MNFFVFDFSSPPHPKKKLGGQQKLIFWGGWVRIPPQRVRGPRAPQRVRNVRGPPKTIFQASLQSRCKFENRDRPQQISWSRPGIGGLPTIKSPKMKKKSKKIKGTKFGKSENPKIPKCISRLLRGLGIRQWNWADFSLQNPIEGVQQKKISKVDPDEGVQQKKIPKVFVEGQLFWRIFAYGGMNPFRGMNSFGRMTAFWGLNLFGGSNRFGGMSPSGRLHELMIPCLWNHQLMESFSKVLAAELVLSLQIFLIRRGLWPQSV